MPKMAHITTARFTDSEGRDRVHAVHTLLQTAAPLGKCQPRAIVGGYFYTNKNSFELHADSRVLLSST
jgi:hypothetical protein